MPRNAFFGREDERALLAAALERTDRYVTLVGPPGNGKTRLALELARTFAGGRVLFLDLTEAVGLDDLVLKVASAVDASGSLEELGGVLGRRGFGLVIFDNFEHLTSARDALEALRRGAAGVRLLVTSRERLGTRSEHRIELGQLRLPLADEAPEASPSVALFVDRAGGGAHDLDCVREIVVRLEGSPLAIELCAQRASLIGPAAVRDQLELGIDVVRSRHVPEGGRFRSLAGALDWSWDLASPVEREALGRFSVFHGGFDLWAARALWAELEEVEPLLDVLEALRDRSLLRVAHDHRYALYEAVREHAARRADPTSLATALELHTRHFLGGGVSPTGFAGRLEDRDAHARLLADRGNLGAVHRRAMAQDPPDVRTAMEALLRLRPLYLARGPWGELVRMIEEVLAAGGELDDGDPHVQMALVTIAECDARRGRFEASLVPLERVRRAGGSRPLRVYVLSLIGGVLAFLQRSDEAIAALTEARRMLDREPDVQLEGHFHEQLAFLMMQQADLASAEEQLERALLVFRAQGDERGQAYAHGFLSVCRLARGSLEGALDAARAAIALSDALGDRRWSACAGSIVGFVAQEQGDLCEAETRLASAEAAFRELRNPWLEGMMSLGLAEIALERGDHAEARRRFAGVLEVERARGERLSTAWALGGLGAVAAREDELEEAAVHLDDAIERAESLPLAALGDAIALRRGELAIGAARRAAREGRPVEPLLDAIGVGLPEAQRRGRSMPVRLVARLISLELDDARRGLLPRLEVGPETEWVEVGGAGRLPLVRRPRLRSVLAFLVDMHERVPNAWHSVDALFEAGWPGERAQPSAVTNRVHVTMTRLRKLGLEPLLESGPEGSRLHRRCTVERP